MTLSPSGVVQFVRATGALLAASALIVGVPALLVASVGNPFPETVPTYDEVRIVLTQSGDGFAQFVLSGLAIVIWFLWIQFVLALTIEVIATIRRRPAPSLPTMPGIQSFAARLVASITLAATLAATPLAPTLGALTFDDVVTPAEVQALGPTSAHPGLAANWFDGHESAQKDPWPQGESGSNTDPDADDVRVTLSNHTELWDLAEAAYGDGTGWKAILQANLGAQTSDGATITSETLAFPAGTSVAIPGAPDLVAVGDFTRVAASTDHLAEVPETSVTHTIVQGESLWTIAEDYAGADASPSDLADYWRNVVDSNRDVPSGDVDLIYPGDQIDLPSATGNSAQTGFEALGGRADDRSDVNDADLWPDGGVDEPATSNASSIDQPETGDEAGDEAGEVYGPVDVSNGRDVDEIESRPSEPVVPEPISTAKAAVPVVDHSAIVDTAQMDGNPADSASPRRLESTPDERVAAAPFVVVGFGAALVAAGIVAALRRRRALQWRMRAPATLPLQPTTDAAAFEVVLAHAAAQVSGSNLGNAWQALPLSALAPVHATTQVHAYADGRLRVVPLDPHDADERSGTHGTTRGDPLTTESDRPEDPSEVTDETLVDLRDGTELIAAPARDTGDIGDTGGIGDIGDIGDIAVWKADAVSESDSAGRIPDSSASSTKAVVEPVTERSSVSVVIGTDLADQSAVLIDIAAGSTVELAGEPHEVARFARSLVVDLATSDRSIDVQVIVIGASLEVAELERVCVVDSHDDAIKAVVKSGHAGGNSGTPVIIVATHNDVPRTHTSADGVKVSGDDCGAWVRDLCALSAIVVAPSLASADVQLAVTNTNVTVWPTGTTVSTAALSDNGYRMVSELVDATRLSAVSPAENSSVSLDVPRPNRCPVEPGPIEVRVLGSVEIAGASPFSSTKAVDVVSYLAFHRNGVDADQLKTWIWPSFEPPTDKAFANVLSRARTGLGVDGEGNPYLSRAGADRTYRLDSAVTTDFDRFRALVDLADQCADKLHELEMLRQGLELIRGIPFTGGTTTSFIWADNHVRAHVEFAMDEAVHRCADLAIDVGELATARWAVLKGLELVPGCEQCFRRRFLVASAANNRQELRRAMADLERTTAAELGEPEAVDLISRDLVALFDELDRALVSGAT